MAIKKVLVTDDSKSARVVLQRMLEGLELEVDAVESAFDAIKYLESYQPDLIFMDHMMPGMDGFEAVKLIKNNPQTAKVPILMYTSKGGSAYVKDAIALGAAGVIPKTISPVALKETLSELGLIESLQVDAKVEVRLQDKDEIKPKVEKKSNKANDFASYLRRLIDDQTIELHKSMWLSVESVANEIFNRLNQKLEKQFEKTQLLHVRNIERSKKVSLSTIFLAILLFVMIILNATLFYDVKQLKSIIINNEGATLPLNNNQHDRGKASDLFGRQDTQNQVAQTNLAQADSGDLVVRSPTTSAFVKWIDNKIIEYPYDELALNDSRISLVRNILSKALESKYRGIIHLQTHVGLFCLRVKQNGDYRLAPAGSSISKCEFIGNGIQPDDAPASHQSLNFANYLSGLQGLTEKGIRIEVTNTARLTALAKYPKRGVETTAAQWNEAAQRNNRITVKLMPEK